MRDDIIYSYEDKGSYILRLEDGANIPKDEDNSDYRRYLREQLIDESSDIGGF